MKINGQKNVKIAIQQKGRLSEKCIELLEQAGLDFDSYKRKLYAGCRNFPLDILYIRDDDIPEYVADGIVDLGIVGEDVILEQQVKVKKIVPLNFGFCALSIACPKGSAINNPKDLNGLKIATTYRNCLKKYLKRNNLKADIIELSGSVEVAPSLSVADCVCDIISTGETMKENNLAPVVKLFDSQAFLIADPKSLEIKWKSEIIERFAMRIESLVQARKTKYVMLNAPRQAVDKIIAMIPGVDSPTIVPLAKSDMVAVHSVVEEEIFWEVIENLKKAGATGILVSPIEKMII
ncbi:ATP phosphoribosyltransferase [Patescibacteria group bacterium]|nr:ATP phosphoribosyltransferase [Patescibacteria group bacterium]